MCRVVKSEPEVNRFNREGTDQTLTAASLIDAIITHQINQPGPNDRQSPAPPSKADILFASFQRSSQQLPPNNIQQITTSNMSHMQGMPNRNIPHNSNEKVEDSRNSNHRLPQSKSICDRNKYRLLTVAWDFLLRWHLGRSY